MYLKFHHRTSPFLLRNTFLCYYYMSYKWSNFGSKKIETSILSKFKRTFNEKYLYPLEFSKYLTMRVIIMSKTPSLIIPLQLSKFMFSINMCFSPFSVLIHMSNATQATTQLFIVTYSINSFSSSEFLKCLSLKKLNGLQISPKTYQT